MCYSTTTGTAKKPMSFPGVVKPSPWPGLQPNSQYHPAMAGHLWPHHHHHNGAQGNHSSDISDKISATTHFKVVPQAYSPVAVKRGRDSDSPISSPFRCQPPVFLFDDVFSKPTPVSSESSPPKQAPSASTPVVRVGDNEENPSVPRTPTPGQLSPTAIARKKRVRRSRCGSCGGCTKKENCGACSVCTNPNATNSVCKLKRCEVLKGRVSRGLSLVYCSQPKSGELCCCILIADSLFSDT